MHFFPRVVLKLFRHFRASRVLNKYKNNKLEIDIRPDDFPERYTPKTETEDGYAKLQLVYKPGADEKAEGTHQTGVRKNKWLHTIRIIMGDIMEDILIQDKSIVYTSGSGGLFKPGIPIGTYHKETEESYEIVNFFSKLSQLTFVKLVSFEESNK